MKIAILTSPRSGSTSLFHLIEEHLDPNYISLSEPFHEIFRLNMVKKLRYENSVNHTFFKNKKNIFIKTFIGDTQIPKSFTNKPNKYWHWFFEYFDKIIILDRKNKQLQSESLTYHLKKKYLKGWHQKQYYDLTDIKKEDIEKTKNILIQDSKEIHSLAGKGYPIFYFEDIFIKKDRTVIENLFKYINLTLNETLYEKYVLSDNFKVRLTENTNQFKRLI